MVGVLVDHDLIASPVPARDDVPEKIAEPEAFPVSSRKHEYMLRSKATGEAPVCPRLIDVIMRIVGATIMSDPLIVRSEGLPVPSRKHEYMLRSKATGEAPVCPRLIDVIMRIVGATIMSDPLIVLGMNVRNFRMTCLVHGNAVLGRGSGLLTPCRGGSARRLGSLRGSRTASGNVSTANRRLVTAAAWRLIAPLILRKSKHANQNG